MSNNKDIIIVTIEGGAAELASTARAVPEDKLRWKPLDNGRTVLDLLGNAAQAPLVCVAVLKGELGDAPAMFARMEEERASWNREQALEALSANTARLIEEVRALPDERMNEMATLPFGGGLTLPLGAWTLMAYRTSIARMAQINYIQTLYGDFDRH